MQMHKTLGSGPRMLLESIFEASSDLLCGSEPLKIDQACLSVSTELDQLSIWAQSQECYECPLWPFGLLNGTASSTLVVNTSWPSIVKIEPNICNFTTKFGEFGHYSLNVTHDSSKCVLEITREPVHWLSPIFYSILIFVLTKLVWFVLGKIYRTRNIRCLWISCVLNQGYGSSSLGDAGQDPLNQNLISPSSDDQDTELEEQNLAESRRKRRIKSLDVFRGIAIAMMIFVNYGGGKYWFFKHAKWNGLTFADLVFPWFMWIMGVSLVISMQSQFRRSVPRRVMFCNIIRRSVILIALGIFLNTGASNNLKNLRIPGVLQRFGISYFIVASLELCFTPRRELDNEPRYPRIRDFQDILSSWKSWISVIILLIIHTCLTFYLPVPGCPRGYIGPGGLYKNASHPNCTGGSAQMIDATVFGSSHIYQRPTAKSIYNTSLPYDPEGLLGVLTSILVVYLGVQCGKTLISFQNWKSRVSRWIIWGFISGIIAGFLCGWRKEEGLIPINKNLWSLSFVLATGSLAFLLFTVIYLLIDVINIWNGSPFQFAGMNPILLYMGHEIFRGYFPFSWKPFSSGHAELLFMNMFGTSLWLLISYILHQNRVILTI